MTPSPLPLPHIAAYLYLIAVGLFTGLSGAMIPGPLLAFVVPASLKKGALAGPLAVLGHFMVEAPVITALLLGLGFYFIQFKSAIYTAGGLALILMGILMIKKRFTPNNIFKNYGGEKEEERVIFGGFLFTAFNPSFIPWWATVGYAILLMGFDMFAWKGVLCVVFGHFLSDLLWYSGVSFSLSRGKKFFGGKYEITLLILAIFLVFLGGIFVMKGLVIGV
jgi:threonine/homoserine/homoserine lactone efflux protein